MSLMLWYSCLCFSSMNSSKRFSCSDSEFATAATSFSCISSRSLSATWADRFQTSTRWDWYRQHFITQPLSCSYGIIKHFLLLLILIFYDLQYFFLSPSLLRKLCTKIRRHLLLVENLLGFWLRVIVSDLGLFTLLILKFDNETSRLHGFGWQQGDGR